MLLPRLSEPPLARGRKVQSSCRHSPRPRERQVRNDLLASTFITRAAHDEPSALTLEREAGMRVLIVICAFNEEKTLFPLLKTLRGRDVLVINDGSTDGTARLASASGANVLNHSHRLGKAASVSDAIEFALQNDYRIIVEIDADTVTDGRSIETLVQSLEPAEVGGASARQIPVGPPNAASHIDELIWAVLSHAKKLQVAKYGVSHLGAVMIAFKPESTASVEGVVNDDEQIGFCIRMNGYETRFVDAAVAYFDASASVGHIIQRRKRMYFGHMTYKNSIAPSMQAGIAATALFKTILEKPSRSPWALPTLFIELISRLAAWRDTRRPREREDYTRWVTTYPKSTTLAVRGIPSS